MNESRGVTVAGRFDPRRNSLNFLRLVFATAVIVSHARPIGGFGRDPELASQAVGTWAVMGFFAISGYLIASSRSHTRLSDFFARRLLRIYPGFLVCLVVVAFCFAPLSVLLGGGHYSLSSGVSYLSHNLALKVERNAVAGTLPNAPYGPAWDGSLWTLFYEFICYVGIGLLLCLPKRWRKQAVVVAFCVCAALGGYGASHSLPMLADRFFQLAPVFLAGSLLCLFADRVRFDWRLGVASLVLLPVATQLHAMQWLGAPLAAYACLWLGVVLPLDRIGRRNDFSYGVYIYAFPMQQLLVVLHVNDAGLALYTIVAILATAPLAMASWFAVERPALSLKKRRAARVVVIPDAAAVTPSAVTPSAVTPSAVTPGVSSIQNL